MLNDNFKDNFLTVFKDNFLYAANINETEIIVVAIVNCEDKSLAFVLKNEVRQQFDK